jgi:hypothetical protein
MALSVASKTAEGIRRRYRQFLEFHSRAETGLLSKGRPYLAVLVGLR